jgi:hypothetical protein
MNWEPIVTDMFSEFPVVVDFAAQGATFLPNLTMMPVVGGAECLDAVQLCRTALVR